MRVYLLCPTADDLNCTWTSLVRYDSVLNTSAIGMNRFRIGHRSKGKRLVRHRPMMMHPSLIWLNLFYDDGIMYVMVQHDQVIHDIPIDGTVLRPALDRIWMVQF